MTPTPFAVLTDLPLTGGGTEAYLSLQSRERSVTEGNRVRVKNAFPSWEEKVAPEGSDGEGL